MTPTDDEVLRALGNDELRGYQVGARIEDAWEVEGRTERFLIWKMSATVGYSTIYRILDRLADEGLVGRSQATGDSARYFRAI